MKLTLLDEPLAVCRLPASERVPSWALELHHAFLSLTRTRDELSVVCPEVAVPPDTDAETGWRALTVAGPLDFALSGVLASLAAPLGEAGVSVLAIATHDTDHLLVRAADLDRALGALAAAGHEVPGHAAAPGRLRVSSGSPFEPRVGFSRALRAGGRVLVAGTAPVMPDGSCPETTLEQARRCWEIALAALAEAGAGAADVVRTRTFLTPDADADGAMEAHGEVFAGVRPVSTMLVVHALLDPRWTVEVEAEAEL
ncbi:MAG TPA: ACT domain-containing protein [Solirubrobacteraceae bacterium]